MGRIKQNFSRGDLVIFNDRQVRVNVYHDNRPFVFGSVLFTTEKKDICVVLSRVSDNNLSVLHYYIRVLFSDGVVGIVVSDHISIEQSVAKI